MLPDISLTIIELKLLNFHEASTMVYLTYISSRVKSAIQNEDGQITIIDYVIPWFRN